MGISVIKLTSGEEVIADISESGGMWKLSKPRVIQMMQTDRGVQAALVPWMITSPDGKFLVNDSHVVTYIVAPKEVADLYLQQTTSIDLSAASKIQL